MRFELRRILKEEKNLKAVRIVLFEKGEKNTSIIQDIHESEHIVQRGFKYNGMLEGLCVEYHRKLVSIEPVHHDLSGDLNAD